MHVYILFTQNTTANFVAVVFCFFGSDYALYLSFTTMHDVFGHGKRQTASQKKRRMLDPTDPCCSCCLARAW
ncbi:hypothetical protein GE21DRAFT_1049604 [Neurospora crassa]|nr:hypothetical protein GE21DRAFT_1049604 [Neurospora crassa]